MGRCICAHDRVRHDPGRVAKHGRTPPIPRSEKSRDRPGVGDVPVEGPSSPDVPSRRQKTEISGTQN